MELILSRHGNTFNFGDKTVWIGSKNDMPLVEKGREQARNLGAALRSQNVKLAAIYCGPLQRTREYAEIVASTASLNCAVQIDHALHEIDYGSWSGLSSEEIIAKFGAEELKGWEEEGRWPVERGWNPEAAEIRREIAAFLEKLRQRHCAKESVLAVTSNGRLRFFRSVIEDTPLSALGKVRTGGLCRVNLNPSGYHIAAWDCEPLTHCFTSV